MKKWVKRMAFALQFLTQYPIKGNINMTARDMARLGACFPFVGLSVGLFGGVLAVIGSMNPSSYIIAACFVLGTTLITGGFHIDGLCDMLDAFFTTTSRRKMLHIMKQSRVGIPGAIGALMDIGVKVWFAAGVLRCFENVYIGIVWLAGSAIAGRLTLATGTALCTSARTGGKGKPFIDGARPKDLLLAALFSAAMLLPVGILANVSVAVTALIIPLMQILLGAAVSKSVSLKLYGITGDTLGMLNELGELMYLGFSMFLLS